MLANFNISKHWCLLLAGVKKAAIPYLYMLFILSGPCMTIWGYHVKWCIIHYFVGGTSPIYNGQKAHFFSGNFLSPTPPKKMFPHTSIPNGFFNVDFTFQHHWVSMGWMEDYPRIKIFSHMLTWKQTIFVCMSIHGYCQVYCMLYLHVPMIPADL